MISKNQIKNFKSLKHKKFREKHSLFLVEGYRNCKELFNSNFSVDHFYFTEESNRNERISKLISYFKDASLPCEIISAAEMNSISDAVNDQGIIAIARIPQEAYHTNLNDMKNILCLESIADPGNLGAIIRTAAWFNVDSIFISNDSVDRFNPKVVRSSAGALFQTPIFVIPDLKKIIETSEQNGFTSIATSPRDGTNIYDFNFPEKSILLFGSEANGLSHDLLSSADITLSIPTKGSGESLNLAISCGIVLGMMTFSKK